MKGAYSMSNFSERGYCICKQAYNKTEGVIVFRAAELKQKNLTICNIDMAYDDDATSTKIIIGLTPSNLNWSMAMDGHR